MKSLDCASHGTPPRWQRFSVDYPRNRLKNQRLRVVSGFSEKTSFVLSQMHPGSVMGVWPTNGKANTPENQGTLAMKNIVKIAALALAVLFTNTAISQAQQGNFNPGFGGQQQAAPMQVTPQMVDSLPPAERAQLESMLPMFRQVSGNPNATVYDIAAFYNQYMAQMQNPMGGPMGGGGFNGGGQMGGGFNGGGFNGGGFNGGGQMGGGFNGGGGYNPALNAQRMQQAQFEHQQRMNQIQAFGAQNTRNFQQRSLTNDLNHQRFLESIRN